MTTPTPTGRHPHPRPAPPPTPTPTPTPGTPGRCPTCGAAVLWTRTRHGLALPVDPIAVEGGNLELLTDPAGAVVAVYVEPGDTIRHVSHFATCSDAGRHQRRARRNTQRK